MREFGYDPIEFGRINFSLGSLSEADLQRRWLCHHDGDSFAKDISDKKKAIVTTGLGLSGVPHVGTLSQILRSITLQKAGLPVNLVLGDLDAYNGKSTPLSYTLELADRYREFALSLGFDQKYPSRLRSQYDSLDVLRTSYLIGHYMDDTMFRQAEEDLHDFYAKEGKTDVEMSYRRKLSLNLMTADFIHLSMHEGFKSVLVMLGIDEHKYVQFARKTVINMKDSGQIEGFDMMIGGLYSPLIKGFYNYPKMSKSFPDSGITADMIGEVIRRKIMTGEGSYDKPENNIVYQMMASASLLGADELRDHYELCARKDTKWDEAKEKYAEMLIDICSKWR
jgi:tryptophanyl-tRNA synthetase